MAVDVVFVVDMGQEANQTYQDVKTIRQLEKNERFSVFAIHENRHDSVEHRRFRRQDESSIDSSLCRHSDQHECP
jgi:hypothetical protein